MNNDSPRPLFTVVAPHDGETLLSVISRSAEANVHVRLSAFLRLAYIDTKKPAFVPFTRGQQIQPLAQYMGLATDAVTKRMHLPSDDGSASVEWYGTSLPRRFIDAETYRFAPESLSKASYQRAQWMLRPLSFCAESMELLTSTCPHCNWKQVWRYRSSMKRCAKCRESLLDVAAGRLAPHLVKCAKQAAMLVDPRSEVRRRVLDSLPDPFRSWSAGEVFAAVVELGVVTEASTSRGNGGLIKKVGSGDFSDFTAEHLVGGFEFVSAWPRSLREFLPKTLTRKNTCDLRKMVGNLSKYFYAGGAPTKLGDLICREVPPLLRESDIPLNGSRGYPPSWVTKVGLVSQNEAVAEFKIDKRTIRKLGAIGRCIRSDRCWDGTPLYDGEQLGASIAALRSAVKRFECGKLLGLPAYCMGTLSDRGLIDEVHDHDALLLAGERIFTRSSVSRLTDKILSAATQNHAESKVMRLVMRQLFHPDDWADIVVALVDGTLRALPFKNNAFPGIGSLLVAHSEARRFALDLPKREFPKNICVSTGQAADLLFINEVAMGRIIRLGLLSGRKGSRRTDISLADLSDFDEKYFVSPEARYTYGLKGQQFGARMRAARRAPVGIAHNLTVWFRKEVEQVLAQTR